MSEYLLVGGPHDGRRVTADGARVLRVPNMHPVSVLSMTRGPQLAMDVDDYELRGGAYRWVGLIADAQASMAVSREAWGEPHVRRYVRESVRRQLQLAPDKAIDGIIWRVDYDPRRNMLAVVALVGGRRVERGLYARDQRRLMGYLPR